MNSSYIKAFLKSMYSYLENTILDKLVDFCDYLQLSKGTELIQEGKRHHFFYFVLRGSVKSIYGGHLDASISTKKISPQNPKSAS